jgi:small-conductance mechanosensitive channel
MNSLYQTISQTLQASVLHALDRVAQFFPNLLSACLILTLGWLLAYLLSRLIAKALETLHADRLAERHGLARTLSDIGFTGTFSGLISTMVYWIILLLTLMPAVEALRLVYFTMMMARILGYLPTLIAAGVIFLVGLSLARFLSNSLTRSARRANLEYAGTLGLIGRYFLSLITIIIALAQLGVQTAILTVILAVILVSAGLATALALGFGSRAVVANILAGTFVRDHFEVGRVIEVQGVRGRIVEVSSVGTTLENEEGIITIPNTVLMDNVVE